MCVILAFVCTDSRENGCIGKMASMISMNADEADSDITRVTKGELSKHFWMPHQRVEPQMDRKQIKERGFRLVTGRDAQDADSIIASEPLDPGVIRDIDPPFSMPAYSDRDAWGGHIVELLGA